VKCTVAIIARGGARAKGRLGKIVAPSRNRPPASEPRPSTQRNNGIMSLAPIVLWFRRHREAARLANADAEAMDTRPWPGGL